MPPSPCPPELLAIVTELLRLRDSSGRAAGSDADEAFLEAVEWFWERRDWSHSPSAVYRVCLRRCMARRLHAYRTADAPVPPQGRRVLRKKH